jgi:hypothetical protein
MVDQTVGQWLKARFIEFQQDSLKQHGELASIEEFAAFLNMNRSTLSMHMGDEREPNDKALRNYATKLKNDSIYDVLGKPRPDADLSYIIKHWGAASDAARKRAKGAIESGLSRSPT